jgi:hypothetical protein
VTVPEGMFTSTSSQADADQQASLYGQNVANQNGTCQSTVPVYFDNYTSSAYTIELYNTATGQTYFLDTYNGNNPLGYVPEGTYDIHITPYETGINTYYSVCWSYFTSGNSVVNFYSVPLNSGCSTITMDY